MARVVRGAESGCSIAAREGAPAVSGDEGAADAQGYGAQGAADVEGFGVAAEHHGNQFAVAGEAAGVCGVDRLPVVHQAGSELGT